MILIINVSKENLHYYEFVKPIEDILEQNNIRFFTKHYRNVNEGDLVKADKVLICGTSLLDNEFIENLQKFEWILDFDKPVLGICAGMQIINLIFGSKLKKETEIGFLNESFSKPFLGLDGLQEVYHLHNNYTSLPKEFESYTRSKIPQAIKHNEKQIYAVLFHPEVRQKDLIKKFCYI